MHKTIYFLKRLGVLHNISISFQPYDERRSCNVVETEFLANYTVFVSLAHMLSVIPKRDGETPKGNMSIEDSHVTSDGHVTSWYTPYWRSSHQCQAISEMRIIHVDMCVKRLG